MHVSKEKMRIVMYTYVHRVEADLHVFQGARLTDIISAREQQAFLAVTNLEVFDIKTGDLIVKVPFANINKSQITMIHPKDVENQEE